MWRVNRFLKWPFEPKKSLVTSTDHLPNQLCGWSTAWRPPTVSEVHILLSLSRYPHLFSQLLHWLADFLKVQLQPHLLWEDFSDIPSLAVCSCFTPYDTVYHTNVRTPRTTHRSGLFSWMGHPVGRGLSYLSLCPWCSEEFLAQSRHSMYVSLRKEIKRLQKREQ